MMTQVKQGDTIKVHYSGKLSDGTVFDSSVEGEPLEFTVGQGQIIPGFEEAVTGMSEGEKTTALVPADQAYGPHHAEGVIDVPRDRIPAEIAPEVGQQLQMQSKDGQPVPVRVVEVAEETIKVDANHPLAGKDLTFDIEVVSVNN